MYIPSRPTANGYGHNGKSKTVRKIRQTARKRLETVLLIFACNPPGCKSVQCKSRSSDSFRPCAFPAPAGQWQRLHDLPYSRRSRNLQQWVLLQIFTAFPFHSVARPHAGVSSKTLAETNVRIIRKNIFTVQNFQQKTKTFCCIPYGMRLNEKMLPPAQTTGPARKRTTACTAGRFLQAARPLPAATERIRGRGCSRIPSPEP